MSPKSLKQGSFQIQNKYNRYFSEDFKKEKVRNILEKQVTIQELSSLYDVSRTTLYRWIYKYSPHHQRGTKQVIEMESEALKTKALLARVAELERVIGQKQMELDYSNKLIELASEELGYDLKKNIGHRRLNGSDGTSQNITTD